ncbi:hypothetical protein K523DRAFT_107794 [Schizophyllum commune Tattone D]|nr:hypothetical protein K523DRAFT_107794 [Schizophyllum commune Tattone D]
MSRTGSTAVCHVIMLHPCNDHLHIVQLQSERVDRPRILNEQIEWHATHEVFLATAAVGGFSSRSEIGQ